MTADSLMKQCFFSTVFFKRRKAIRKLERIAILA